ncbi:SH3 domain-containing protein [Aquimixticola soesokkakensis]|nr:SH3 domain-containing protein [Aquimixticola soesokkakensis]
MPEPSFEPIEPIRDRGPVTNLPLPRFVSLKASEANVRRGPSLTHRIDWVFQRRNMPLEVTEEYENWRRVRDRDGAGGWVYHTLISGVRYALVTDAHIALRTRASEQAAAVADLEQNVVARILECSEDWCRLNADGYKGWVPKTAIWGVSDAEVID